MRVIKLELGNQPNNSNSHYGSIVVIPAWMPESSAMDGDMSVAKMFEKGLVANPSFTSL